MTLNYFLSALPGYLFGSLPSAYLLVRWKTARDIRQSGSGNVGALNSYLVTRSRAVGVAVFLLDFSKGILAALVPRLLLGGGLAECAVGGLAAVVGHNFSVWLKFKGGRGLSAAAGVALVLAWPIIPAWVVLWAVGFLLTRNVNFGNALATVLLIVAALAVPSSFLEQLVAGASTAGGIRLFVVLILGVVLIKHIAPVREFFQRRRMTARPEGTGAEV